MPEQKVTLKPITRDDVSRIKTWLEDEEISESWFGRYSYGDPAHLGYHPAEMEKASDAEWERVFSDPEHRILSICTEEGEHIGELHFAIEESLGDAHLSILIGRKDRPPVDPHRAKGPLAQGLRNRRNEGGARRGL